LSNDSIDISLPVFAKFCMPVRNVVGSTPVVFETNRKFLTLEVCRFQFMKFLGCSYDASGTKFHTVLVLRKFDGLTVYIVVSTVHRMLASLIHY